MAADVLPLSAWLPVLLQSADPLFPTGAYAHSFGLEEMARLGVVSNEEALTIFLTDHLLPLLQRSELPYLRFAMACTRDLKELIEVDHEINALKIASESRSSSIQIGIRRITTLKINHAHPILLSYADAIRKGSTYGHHLCACAVQAITLKSPLEAALLTYSYQSLAGACTAALKLLRIGQDGCQRALSKGICHLPEIVAESMLVEREDAGCFSPMLEIAAMRHAFANERLFIS